MGDERKNDNPVNTGISLFKVLLIVVLIIIVGLLFYVYKRETEVYDDDSLFLSSNDDDNFYYKGVPDRTEESSNEKKELKFSTITPDNDPSIVKRKNEDINYSSSPKSFNYEGQSNSEEQILEKFNNTLKNNLILSKVTIDPEDDDTICCEITNNNAEAVSGFDLQIAFYDANNKLTGIRSIDVDYISANSTLYISDCDTKVDFARFDYIFTKDYALYEYKECKNDIQYEIDENEEDEEYIVHVKNKSNHDIDGAVFFAKYYDAAGNDICVRDNYASMYHYNEPSNGLFGRKTDYEDNNTDEIRFSKHLYKTEADGRDIEIPFAKCEITYYTSYYEVDVDV